MLLLSYYLTVTTFVTAITAQFINFVNNYQFTTLFQLTTFV